jgi:UDP-N-acetylglucosamine acyltransferase
VIHQTAIVDPRAELTADVEIGPYSIIGPDVTIGPGTRIGAHVTIEGPTRIGADNHVYQFASLGAAPQDKKYAGEPTRLEIGDGNTIREFCTLNRGTVQDAGATRIGDNNWIMAYVHIAHDCQVGNSTILANNASLAGHVHLFDHAILGGFTLVHQFCKIGSHVMTAVGSVIFKDVPPYVTASGYDAQPHGINVEGLKRRGYSPERIANIKRAYKMLYRNGLTLEEARTALQMQDGDADIRLLLDFLGIAERGIIR